MAISSSKAKAVCSDSEWSLVVSSGKAQIKLLSAPQLRQKKERARKLRDKWRDQAQKQRRAAQAKKGARQTSSSARSDEKAELFQEVLSRFEAELAKPKSDRTAATRPRKLSPLKTRVKTHRAVRAEVRDELRETRREISVGKRSRRTATAAKAMPAAPSAAAETKSTASVDSSRSKPPTAIVTESKAARSTSAPKGLQVTKRKQRRASTQAKQDRLKAAGVVRIQKHISAQNRRRQAKRDAR